MEVGFIKQKDSNSPHPPTKIDFRILLKNRLYVFDYNVPNLLLSVLIVKQDETLYKDINIEGQDIPVK